MPDKAILYEDVDGTTYEVELPLTSNVDPEEIREEIGVPSYVDMNYFPMKSAMVTIWAAVNAKELINDILMPSRRGLVRNPSQLCCSVEVPSKSTAKMRMARVRCRENCMIRII